MSSIVLGGHGAPFVVAPVRWPNEQFGGVDGLAIRIANDFLRELGPTFNADRYGFRLMHHLAAQPWDELAGLYVWTGEPSLPPVLVTLEEYEAVGDAAQTLELLGHVDEPGLGIETTAIDHPRLGTGSRHVRRVKERRGMFRSVVRHEARWVWRVEGAWDVVVTFGRDDADEFARILPDVEELVATARASG